MRLLVAVLMLVGVAGAQGQAWTAKWIQAPWSTVRDGAEVDGSRPMPIFRREFTIRGKVTKAELRIAGLGQFEARIDGREVGSTGLHEAWTDYRKTVAFESYDISKQVPPGPHAIGIMLGNGMYNVQKSLMANGKPRYTKFEGSFGAPRLIAEVRITYADGHMDVIASNDGWKCAPGPVTFTSTFGGEDFDARKEATGWDRAAFNDADWALVKRTEGPGGTLVPAIAPEVVVAATHSAIKTTEIAPNKFVYDLGQNFAGVPHVRMRGYQGLVLKLTPGELLKPDGSVTQASSGGPMWWTYTLSGSSDGEDWHPRFGYYGFRYLQAEWIVPPRPDGVPLGGVHLDEVSGLALQSASKSTGTFESSKDTLNAIHKLIVAAMHNNEVSLFTDCPHREKLGWLEQTHLVADALLYNDDLRGLYAATARNIADAQHDDGDVPTIAPQYTKFGPKSAIYDDSPEWGSASVLAPWAVYRFYGERTQMEQNYPVMQKYVAYLEGKAVDGIVAYGLGDWYDIGPGGPGFSKLTTPGVTGTLMLYEDAVTMRKIAALLGKGGDAARYGALAEKTKAAFNARFYDAAQGFYDMGSQTAQAMPLALGIVPEAARAKVLAKLVDDIHAHDDHVTTGEVGYPYLLRVLMDNGYNDLVLAMMLRTDPPSYGSQLAAGATALTEAWDANPKNSQDHFMLGAGDEWFYRGLGGIDVDMSRAKPEERITIRPAVYAMEPVEWVKTSYASVLGTIMTEWHEENAIVTLTVDIPPGHKATVILSGVQTDGHGKVIGKGEQMPDGTTHFIIGPGRHTFEDTVLIL